MASKMPTTFDDLTKENVSLSAEELFKYRLKKNKTVPSKGGQKDFEPDGSWMQSKGLEAFLQERTAVLREPRVEKLKSLVQGVWDDEKKLVNLDKPGKFWAHMGFTDMRRNWLYPEEALFLMEVNSLELRHREVPLSVQEAHDLLLVAGGLGGGGTGVSLAEYQVFAHLRRLGYVVMRFESTSVITDYEREINLHKYMDKKSIKERKKKNKEKNKNSENPDSSQTSPLTSPILNADASACSSSSSLGNETLEETPKKSSVEEETNTNDISLSSGKNPSKRARADETGENSGTEEGSSQAKKLCIDRSSPSHASKSSHELNICSSTNSTDGESSETTSSVESGASRVFYPDSWSDCFSGGSQLDQSRKEQSQKDSSLKKRSSDSGPLRQTSWPENCLDFPDLGGKEPVPLACPKPHLLPAGVTTHHTDLTLGNPIKPAYDNRYEDADRRMESLVFSFAEWTQRRPVVKALNWADYRKKMDDRLKEMSHVTPVQHLWQGAVTPLVKPCDAWNADAILEKLRIVKPAEKSQLIVKKPEDSNFPAVSFDVHLPDKSFKKTMTGKPDHRVVVARSSDSAPDLAALARLLQQDGVPVHWAVVDHGELAFYCWDTLAALPTLSV